jgi:hypothetical protein
MTKRGRVQRDTSIGDGVVAVEGKQYVFQLEGMWRSELPSRAGMLVDVTFDSVGVPLYMVAVPDSQIAKEQAEQTLAGAKRHGTAIAGGLKARYGLPVIVAEAVMLIAFFLMPNIAFGNEFAKQNFSGWDAIGLSVNTMSSNDHGLLSLIAIVFLFAPLAASFLQKPWARFLYLAPLAFVVLAFLTIFMQIQNASHAATQAAGDLLGGAAARQVGSGISEMIHVDLGAYLVIVCAIYLATRTFKVRA